MSGISQEWCKQLRLVRSGVSCSGISQECVNCSGINQEWCQLLRDESGVVSAAQGLVGNGVSCSGINQEWCQLLRD